MIKRPRGDIRPFCDQGYFHLSESHFLYHLIADHQQPLSYGRPLFFCEIRRHIFSPSFNEFLYKLFIERIISHPRYTDKPQYSIYLWLPLAGYCYSHQWQIETMLFKPCRYKKAYELIKFIRFYTVSLIVCFTF